MATLPSSLALTTIADGALAVAADHRNNFSAIQTEANGLLGILDDGAAGQFLAGVGTTLSWLQPPGTKLDHASITANVSVTATTEATATTVVTGSSLTYDGATEIEITFNAPGITKGTTSITLWLYDNGASIGAIGGTNASTGQKVSRVLTPSAGAHQYSIRASVDAGTGSVTAGVGGAAANVPAYLRIKKG